MNPRDDREQEGQVFGGPDGTGPWNKPARVVSPIPTILSTGDGLPLNPNRGQVDGRGANRVIARASGRWSSCRVYVDVPAAWLVAQDVALELVAVTEGGYHEVTGFLTLTYMGLETYGSGVDARVRGYVAGVSGMACTGFIVYARSKSNWTNQQNASLTLECWGDDSEYQTMPGALACNGDFSAPTVSGVVDKPMPFQGAGLMYFDPANQKWRPVTGNTTGGIILGGGSTVSQAYTNRAAGGTVTGQADNRGSQYILDALPDPAFAATDSPSTGIDQVGRANFKATPGYALEMTLSNTTAAALFYLLVNKATAPAGGETSVYTVQVPANGTLHIPFKYPQYFSLGVSGAWSTTPTTVTVIGSGNPVVSIHYN